MDICGSPAGKLILRDSNPGFVSLRPGGVGRNIAHNLCLMGLDVSLVAALGGDVYAAAILESCAALNMDMSMARVLPDYRSSTYLYVTDESGDMEVGISDMEIVRNISPAYLEPLMDGINRASAVVIDANLSPETIAFIAENCTVPIYADPVSTVKAERLKPVLGRLFAVKPNRMEAEHLTGEKEAELAAKALLDAGVKRVFISLGAEGMLAGEENKLLRLPNVQAQVVNTTGAGDAATAALVWAGVNGLDLQASALAALRAGALTTECVEANNPKLAEVFSI